MLCVREILKRAVGGGFEEGHEEGDEKDKKVEQGEGEPSPRKKSRKPQKEEKPENICRDHAFFAVEPICQGAHKGAEEHHGDHGDSHEDAQMEAALFVPRIDYPPRQGDGEEFVPHRRGEAAAEKFTKVRKEHKGMIPQLFQKERVHEALLM